MARNRLGHFFSSLPANATQLALAVVEKQCSFGSDYRQHSEAFLKAGKAPEPFDFLVLPALEPEQLSATNRSHQPYQVRQKRSYSSLRYTAPADTMRLLARAPALSVLIGRPVLQ